MKERVSKIMANAGLCSRRKADELIKKGLVFVNGQKIKLGDKAVAFKDQIVVGEKPLIFEKKRYLVLNKPRGYLTTVSDPYGKKVVMHLIKIKERVYPVGRLDKDSEGLLLFTNDGDFAYRILHPHHEIKKTYRVRTKEPISDQSLACLKQGIVIEGRKTAPAQVKRISLPEIEIAIHEGRKRIIRKMMAHLGYQVQDLIRIKIGHLELKNLKPGQYRNLTKKEIDLIFTK